MTLVDSNGKNPLVGSLLIFGFLAAGLVATSAGYSSTLLVPMLCAAAGVTALWCRQQSRQHREKYLALQALHGSEAPLNRGSRIAHAAPIAAATSMQPAARALTDSSSPVAPVGAGRCNSGARGWA